CRRAARADRAHREPPRPERAHRSATKVLVWIDRVVAPAVVEDVRAGHERDAHPLRGVAALREQLSGHAGRRLEPVERAAGEADRVDDSEVLAVDSGRSTTDVDLHRSDLRKVEHGAARGPLGVLGRADLETREVELE